MANATNHYSSFERLLGVSIRKLHDPYTYTAAV